MNQTSVILGLVAWVLAVANLVRRGKGTEKSFAVLLFVSVATCAGALCFQIYYANHLVTLQDWAALMDTSGAVSLTTTVLLVVTVVLNVASLAVCFKR